MSQGVDHPPPPPPVPPAAPPPPLSNKSDSFDYEEITPPKKGRPPKKRRKIKAVAMSILSDSEGSSGDEEWQESHDVGEFGSTLPTWSSEKKCKRVRNNMSSNGGLPNFHEGLYDKEYWHAEPMEEFNNKFIRLKDKTYGPEYVIPVRRINKALRFLHYPTIQRECREKFPHCRCRRHCAEQSWSTVRIAKLRYSYFKQPTEWDSTKYLAHLVVHEQLQAQGDESIASEKIKWVVQKEEVCPTFFRLLFGISNSKLQQVRQAISNGSTGLPPKNCGGSRQSVQYGICRHFWREFFKTCQRPNRATRLFPTNASYPTVYEDYFLKFFKKYYPSSDNLPSLSTFNRARHDDEFLDVKRRSRHHHCRCETCAKLQARKLRGFKDEADMKKYEADVALHDTEKKEWRAYEERILLEAKHNPQALNAYWYDDTEKIGLPKFTKREHKNLPTTRFFLIPFLLADLSRGIDRYVYTAKNRFKKGANRLCTSLYYAFRATKAADVPASRAKRLVLLADNFAENKNNTVFAFCSMLVMLGWYDSIELMYGPPGHTHNGGDQQHQIHNEVLGNFTCCSFPHLISRYPQAWRSEHSRPEPAVLDVQYNWDAFFRPSLNAVGGYTNTTQDPLLVRGFKFSRDPNGVVTMKWKMKAESGEWRGVDGQEGSPGFVILKRIPRGMPGIIEPDRDIMQQKYYSQLTGTKFQDCCEAEGEPHAMEWNAQAAKHGVLPIDSYLQPNMEVTPGNLGTNVQIRCGDTTAEVQLITQRSVSAQEFWALPASLQAYREEDLKTLANREAMHCEHACIGYQNVRAGDRPTYVGSARERRDKERVAAAEEHKESDIEDSSDEDKPLHKTNASRHAPQPRQEEEDYVEETVEEQAYDVHVLFGANAETQAPELWFGLKLSSKAKNTWKIQWLEQVTDDKVILFFFISFSFFIYNIQ